MLRYTLSIPLMVMLVAVTAVTAADVAVEPDKENVVASRLEGTWQPHPGLTKRLTGDVKPRPRELPFAGNITFESDSSVAEKLPDEHAELFIERSMTIYLAGYAKSAGESYPFVVTHLHGNPHVLIWIERDGDPFGNGESFNVMIAVAGNKRNDVLFVGGDRNNQSFSAYERADVQGTPTDDGTSRIRLINRSQVALKNVVVKFPSGEESFGTIPHDGTTDRREVERAYRYSYIEATVEGQPAVIQPIDYVGETLLGSGKYAYALTYNRRADSKYGRLQLELVEE